MNWLDFLVFLGNVRKLKFDSKWSPLEEYILGGDPLFHIQKPEIDTFVTKYSNGPCNPSSGAGASITSEPSQDAEWTYVASKYANGPGFWTQVTHHDDTDYSYVATKYANGPIRA